ncbi:ABC transporter substrate-binding protein [Georgenia sp. Z1491]|uniref:ABC transporter substrate-binding protein n=1 Tax=Georgenia sp. Z1491 TaxID=3416707 RepID=UPI003CE8778D
MASRVFRAGAVAVGVALLVTACGAGGGETDGGGESASGEGLDVVRLGIFPGATFASVEMGIDEGSFADRGIELELNMGQGGAELLPALTSGSLDVAVGNPVSVIQAHHQGLPITLISGYAADGPGEDDTTSVVAMPDAGIESASDLEGMSVAVNSLNGALELGIRESIRLDGGDPDNVEFVEVGFPDMPSVLENGDVDAVTVGQPFMGSILANGGEIVLDSQNESGTESTILVTFASDEWVDEDAELVDRFLEAWAETLDHARENPDLVRERLPEFIGMEPEIAEDLPLEVVSAELDRGGLETYARLMVEYDVIADDPDLDALIRE